MSKHLVLILALLTVHLLQCASDPDDNRCLSQFSKNVEDPNNNLNNWSESVFAKPCNGFTSLLRGATCNNGRIYKLSLQNFSLRGRISPYLSNCSNLQSLDLSSNSFTGEIPKDLKTLVNLAILNLSSNKLSGNIPPEIADCAYLNIIDLHNNSLSGQIPPQLGTLVRLSSFDVSNNQLSGPIPSNLVNRSGNLPMLNASSFIENKHLYGYPLPQEKTRSLSVMAIVAIGFGSGVLSLILSFTVVCFWLRVTKQRAIEEDDKNVQFTPEH